VIKTAAIQAGRNERQTTIEDGLNARARLLEEGKTVYEPTTEETDAMKVKMQTVYDEFESSFAANLIERIKRA